MKAIAVHNGDIPLLDLGGGVSRKVLAYTQDIMAVEVRFEKGGVGSLHTHPHAQCTYIVSGEFRFTAGEEIITVRPGDSIAFPPNLPHGTTCLKAGTLVDVFTPMRADFV